MISCDKKMKSDIKPMAACGDVWIQSLYETVFFCCHHKNKIRFSPGFLLLTKKSVPN